MVYQNIVTGIMLTIAALEDLADRRIRSSSLILFLSLVVIGKPENILAGAVPGMFCLLLSWLTHEKLGYGDSFMILISGISLGAEQEINILFHAFLFAGIWSAVKLVKGKTEKNWEFPFLPFLLAGWGWTVLITF